MAVGQSLSVSEIASDLGNCCRLGLYVYIGEKFRGLQYMLYMTCSVKFIFRLGSISDLAKRFFLGMEYIRLRCKIRTYSERLSLELLARVYALPNRPVLF